MSSYGLDLRSIKLTVVSSEGTCNLITVYFLYKPV